MRRRIHAPVLASAVSALAVVLAGCGDDEAGPDDLGPVDDRVTVVAEDISFPRDVYRAEAGRVGFEYVNEGRIEHTLLIEDPAGDGDIGGFDLLVTSEGDVDRGAVDLAPGTYTLYCDVAGHRAAGMVAELRVAP